MKNKINRNILWTESFVKELAALGVKFACISPGSRNTPLTWAFANNKKIKSYLHIDERSCGFFALGLAKASGTPVAIICTSGTAVAELYPAIIEAYQQRVPLIICTADRPPELQDCGANQTINQNNIYKNHIRWFFDVGLPEPIVKRLKHIKAVARRSFFESCLRSRGPVHINFPFRKPFEPGSYTDEVPDEIMNLCDTILKDEEDLFKEEEKNIHNEKWFPEIFSLLQNFSSGLIIAGPENYSPHFHNNCTKLSQKLGYPILADGASQLRFGKRKKDYIISNFDALLRSESFCEDIKPEIILQFGRTITSKALESYLEKCDTLRFMFNEYGDWFDPSNRAAASFACKPYLFCEMMIDVIDKKGLNNRSNKWTRKFIDANEKASLIKKRIIESAKFPNEPRIIKEILNVIPDNSNLMISNSMPIRDFDYFASKTDKNITIFNNRGASGIDGIISTALGIASLNKKLTILLTGDLAFYYDLNGLLAAKKYNIPLVIILVNNNGGGIFEVLPISEYRDVFREFFIAPHDLEFKPFVEGFGGNYKLIKSWKDFENNLNSSFKKKNFTVLEIKTVSSDSLKLRRNYWKEVDKKILEKS